MQGIGYLEDTYARLVGLTQFSDSLKAYVANKVGMLAYIVDSYEVGIKYGKLAVSLQRDPTYFYNLATLYAETDKKTELDETLKVLAQLPNLDEDHRKLLAGYGLA